MVAIVECVLDRSLPVRQRRVLVSLAAEFGILSVRRATSEARPDLSKNHIARDLHAVHEVQPNGSVGLPSLLRHRNIRQTDR
jgi:hypothetical protein